MQSSKAFDTPLFVGGDGRTDSPALVILQSMGQWPNRLDTNKVIRPVASNFSGGFFLKKMWTSYCNNQGAGAVEEFVWCVHCPHS